LAALVKSSLLALAVLPLLGQTLNSPFTTLVFHAASRSLRPIVGMTGSSYLGPSVYPDLDFGSVSPDQKTAIIETAGRVTFIRSMQNQETADVETAITAIDLILWSDDSSTAILFSAANRQIQWITNGKAGSATDLPNGTRLLAAQCDAQGAIAASDGRVYRITPDTAPVQIATFGDPTAAATDATGNTIYIADAATQQILVLSNNGGGYNQRPFLAATEEIPDRAALLLSADGATLYVAMKSARTLSAYSTADKTLTTRLALDWVPSSFERLSKETYLLNPGARVGEPFSVLSTRNGLAESFIPTGDAK